MLKIRGVFFRDGVAGVMPAEFVPDVAVFLEGTSLGINEAVCLDKVHDVVTFNGEVEVFSFHAVSEVAIGASDEPTIHP